MVEDVEQAYLLDPLNNFLAHPATGVERMTEISASWKDVAQSFSNNETLKRGVSVMLKAPADRKFSKARIDGVLRMLPEDHEGLLLRAHWPRARSANDEGGQGASREPRTASD